MALNACAAETGSSELGEAQLFLSVDGILVDRVSYVLTADVLEEPLRGSLPVQDDRVASSIRNLPVGTGYVLRLSVTEDGRLLCDGLSAPFSIAAGESTRVDIELRCGETPDDARGNVEVAGNFETLPRPPCPLIHSVSAIPPTVLSGEESLLEVVATDLESRALRYVWMADAGSFDDPSSSTPVYSCDAEGPQTLSVEVGNGEEHCRATRELLVDCAPPAQTVTSWFCFSGAAVWPPMNGMRLDLEVAPGSSFVSQESTDVSIRTVVFFQDLGRRIMELRSDILNIDSLRLGVQVLGGEPQSVTLEWGPQSLDVDVDNDGSAEDVSVELSSDVSVTSGLVSSVEFSIESVELRLSRFPVLGNAVFNNDNCSLVGETASFTTH